MKRWMKPGCRIPEPRVRMAWEGGEGGGGELHRVEERVRRLLLVRHLLGPTIQRWLPTSLFWLRLQSSGSAGSGGAEGHQSTWVPAGHKLTPDHRCQQVYTD